MKPADAGLGDGGGLVIRLATPADAAGIARVLNKVISGGRHSLLDTPFSDKEERVYIQGLAPRGFIHVVQSPAGEIVALQTIEPYASFALAREHRFAKVFTDIRADNPESVAFHRALGFSVVGTAKRLARLGGRYVDVVFVECDL